MGPLTSLLDIGKTLIEKLIPDPKAKAEATLRLLELEQAGDLAVIQAQVEINKAEAANANVFISGWRPMVGWICAAGLGMQFIGLPLVTWGSILINHAVVLPALDMSMLMTLLIGMLGLGGMRTVEKLSGAEHRR